MLCIFFYIYIIRDKKIVCPLSIIRNVGINISNVILSERQKGEFTNFIDFVKRTYNKSVNRKVLESLILAGTFSSFNYNKKTLMLNIDNIINYAELSSDNTLSSLYPNCFNFLSSSFLGASIL